MKKPAAFVVTVAWRTFLFVIGPLVLAFAVHEGAHYFMFRACGVGVSEFRLLIGPEIAGVEIGETRYSLGCLPIGAYVMPSAAGAFSAEEIANIKALNPVRAAMLGDPARQAGTLAPWQEFLMLAAGPIANLATVLLGFALWLRFHGVLTITQTPDVVVTRIDANSPAASGGLAVGDLLLAVDTRPVREFFPAGKNLYDAMDRLFAAFKRATKIAILRNGREVVFKPPAKTKGRYWCSGAAFASQGFEGEDRPLPWLPACLKASSWIYLGIRYELEILAQYLAPWKWNGSHRQKQLRPLEQIGRNNPVGLLCYWSLVLGVLNLIIPMPPLDGGKIWFSLYAMLGGTVSEDVRTTTCVIGALLFLTIFWIRPILWGLGHLSWRLIRPLIWFLPHEREITAAETS